MTTISIEVFQFVTMPGNADIDDVMLNVAGNLRLNKLQDKIEMIYNEVCEVIE